MMKLRPYPEYKDSGVEWLGELPGHWKPRRLKYCSTVIMGQSPPGDEYNIDGRGLPFLQGCAEFGVHHPKPRQYCPSANKIGSSGSILLSVRAPVGRINVADQDYGIGRGLCAIMPSGEILDSRFAVYGLQTCRVGLAFESTGSTYDAVTVGNVANLSVCLPPFSEQRQIAIFLDAKTRLIDRFIRNKGRLIELLQEQKQAVINNCVTGKMEVRRIVDENGNSSFRLQPSSCKMRDSGIDWLGEIPEHWELLRCKYIFRESDGRSKTGQETQLSMSQKFGIVPSSMIEERRLVSESYVGAKLVKSNDLVLNRLKAHLGVFALAFQDGLVSPDYTILRPIRMVNMRYFELLLRTTTCRIELRRRAKGIVEGFWRLYTDDLYDIRLPFPLPAEQEQIAHEVDELSKEIDNAISQAQRQIDLIQEYRTRLIADVVTGKVDVRGIPVEDVAEDEALAELVDKMDEGLLDDDEYVEEAEG